MHWLPQKPMTDWLFIHVIHVGIYWYEKIIEFRLYIIVFQFWFSVVVFFFLFPPFFPLFIYIYIYFYFVRLPHVILRVVWMNGRPVMSRSRVQRRRAVALAFSNSFISFYYYPFFFFFFCFAFLSLSRLSGYLPKSRVSLFCYIDILRVYISL